MYAIKNKRTGRWFYGSKRKPSGMYIQLTSYERAILFEDEDSALALMINRQMAENYITEEVALIPVRLIPDTLRIILSKYVKRYGDS